MKRGYDHSDLLYIDSKHIWHPYTQMAEYEGKEMLFVVKAKGCKLYDNRGKFYYDTISSWWCNLLGHNQPEINEAISHQLEEFEHTLFAGVTHKPAIELVKELKAIVPSHLVRYFFSDNGSTAVEVALKMSYQYWQMRGKCNKKLFIFLENGYHGDTIGAMSVSGVSQFNSVFKGLFFDSIMIPSPADDFDASINSLKKTLCSMSDKICAIIVEPILQGAGGMKLYDEKFLTELEYLREKFGIHIIVDEIATGFGRLGKWFAHTDSGLKPDFMCVSKSITNGTLPLALTVTTEDIYREFWGDYNKTFFHGHTFTANPLACIAAVTTLRLVKKKNLLVNVNNISSKLEELAAWMRGQNLFSKVATKGVILRAELSGLSRKDMLDLYWLGLDYNILIRPLGNVVYLFLPITISVRELEDIIRRYRMVFTVFAANRWGEEVL